MSTLRKVLEAHPLLLTAGVNGVACGCAGLSASLRWYGDTVAQWAQHVEDRLQDTLRLSPPECTCDQMAHPCDVHDASADYPTEVRGPGWQRPAAVTDADRWQPCACPPPYADCPHPPPGPGPTPVTSVELVAAARWLILLRDAPAIYGTTYRGALGMWLEMTSAPNETTGVEWAETIAALDTLPAHTTPF